MLATTESGDIPVEAPITCVITRFGLRGTRHLLPSLRDYRRVQREAAQSATPGLLRSAFLMEDPATWFGLSLWSEPGAIPHFGTEVPGHVPAARRAFPRLRMSELYSGPELWSTKWRLISVSNNLNWADLDLRGALSDWKARLPDER